MKSLEFRDVVKESLEFRYQFLSRLQQDCRYYLGNGNRNKRHLFYLDEKQQIKEMKRIYKSFTPDQKPRWIKYKDILKLQFKMKAF